MAVERDMLYPIMRRVGEVRELQGFETNMRAIRAMLEHGHYDARGLLDGCRPKVERMQDRSWFAPLPEGSNASCWINLRGMIFSIGYGQHGYFADLVTGVEDPILLEQAGWVHVSDNRIDIEFDPTPYQQQVIDHLSCKGFRVSDRRVGFSRSSRDSPGNSKVPQALSLIAPMRSYDWEAPRYWEERGIPRTGCSAFSHPSDHVQLWLSETTSRIWDGREGESLTAADCEGIFVCYPKVGWSIPSRVYARYHYVKKEQYA